MSAEWKCNVCNKSKDLRGPHLAGKKTVRSDCWPCAKKQTFHLKDATAEAPKIADTSKPSTASPFSAPPQFLFSQPTAAKSPFGQVPSASAASTIPAAPTTAGQPSIFSGFGGGKTGNPFAPAPAGIAVTNPFAAAPPTSTAAPAAVHQPASSGSIVMQASAPPKGKGPHPSPPFSFVSNAALAPPQIVLGPTGMPFATAPVLSNAASAPGEEIWKCAVCQKSKDLRGKHLDNKSTVRSDCWPCAKKQTFVRCSADGKPLASCPQTKPAVPVSTPLSANVPTSATSPAFRCVVPSTPAEPVSTTDTLKTSSSFVDTPVFPFHPTANPISAFTWREPEVPSVEGERTFFIQSVNAVGGTAARKTSSPYTEVSLSSAFYEQTLAAFLRNSRSMVYTRSLPIVWDANKQIAYVTCTHFANGLPPTTSNFPTLRRSLGELASILVYLQATTPGITRVFCTDTFTFAAAALFQAHLDHDLHIFGPAPDKTTKPSLLDDIVSVLNVNTRVTSGEQRNAAAKALWSRNSISVMPNSAVGEAIRKDEAAPAPGTVDVVLLLKSAAHDDGAHFHLLIA